MNVKLSIAPMMNVTNRHFRYFLRLITPHALLYTEMITTWAIMHGDASRLLYYDPTEHPLALQLGGSDPKALAICAKIAEDYGYDEINLNVGCPSDRVQCGQFGACLMKQPELVAKCFSVMQASVKLPVSIKMRIGVDHIDSYDYLQDFVARLEQAGCRKIIIHARKAWLRGLSPKENRTLPPLRYDVVYRIKKDFPQLAVIINGGIHSMSQVKQHLVHVDGVMIGRQAQKSPYFLAQLERTLFHNGAILSPDQVILHYLHYVRSQLREGASLKKMTKPMLGLFAGSPGAKTWRHYVAEVLPRDGVEACS